MHQSMMYRPTCYHGLLRHYEKFRLPFQLFSSTGVLSGTEEEVTVWLQELCSSTESENREIFRFLEQVFFTALIKDPYRFSEEVKSF